MAWDLLIHSLICNHENHQHENPQAFAWSGYFKLNCITWATVCPARESTLFQTSISQAPDITQKKFSTRNKTYGYLLSKNPNSIYSQIFFFVFRIKLTHFWNFRWKQITLKFLLFGQKWLKLSFTRNCTIQSEICSLIHVLFLWQNPTTSCVFFPMVCLECARSFSWCLSN